MPVTKLLADRHVVLPEGVVDELHLSEGAELQVEVHEGKVILAPGKPDWRSLRGSAKDVDLLTFMREEKEAEFARDEERIRRRP